jgi:hypothetical protein
VSGGLRARCARATVCVAGAGGWGGGVGATPHLALSLNDHLRRVATALDDGALTVTVRLQHLRVHMSTRRGEGGVEVTGGGQGREEGMPPERDTVSVCAWTVPWTDGCAQT